MTRRSTVLIPGDREPGCLGLKVGRNPLKCFGQGSGTNGHVIAPGEDRPNRLVDRGPAVAPQNPDGKRFSGVKRFFTHKK